MSLEWDDVLGRILRVIETRYSQVSRVCVIRDLRGRVRLAAAQGPEQVDSEAIEAAFRNELGRWFAPPVLWADAPTPDIRRLAQNLLSPTATWPAGWPRVFDDGVGAQTPISPERWCGQDRVRSKHSWLTSKEMSPPWPLNSHTPAVASFYSFKGGVGRTTTLSAVARLLAQEHPVVVVDLDLEAPGLGRLFDVDPDRGILDLLVEHLATGTIDRDDLTRHCETVPIGRGITVFPVGRMEWSYLEKLGRLDFAPPLEHATGSPVEAALRAVLDAIKAAFRPSYILLDSRAGLHDIGGLSLHTLSHLDVMIGRGGAATLDGFRVSLDAMARRPGHPPQLLFVQTFLPLPLKSDESSRLQTEWRDSLWDCLTDTLDRAQNREPPAVTDNTARHYPLPVPNYDTLAHVETLTDIDTATLDAEPFQAIASRIHELCLGSVTEEGDADGS